MPNWRFLRDELRLVVLAQGLTTAEEYLRAPRRGRGTRLDRPQRAGAWQAMEAYRAREGRDGRVSYAGLAAAATDVSVHVPGYRHVVVDEAQDLQPVHWNLLGALTPVDANANDVFVCEDGHQRIYGNRVVLSHHGIATRGRSRRLTLNYRTTRQNLALSLAVLGGTAVPDLDGDEDGTVGTSLASPDRPRSSGPTPRAPSRTLR